MTKSTGARARQYRLENLLWADVMLRRIGMHLQESIAWAARGSYGAEMHVQESIAWAARGSYGAELRGLWAAYSYVRTAYLDVTAEQKVLQEQMGSVIVERRRTVYEDAADLR